MRQKRRKGRDPAKVLNYTYDRYGITCFEFFVLLEKQGALCKICKTDDPSGKNWHVDHCHKTSKVRGILCANCNVMIAQAKDNPDILKAGVKYLCGS